MAHVKKFTKGQAPYELAHVLRTKVTTSESVDPALSHNNYGWVSHVWSEMREELKIKGEKTSDSDYYKHRLKQLRCLNRKDVKTLASWIVTAPKSLPREELKKFFYNTTQFLEKRYGGSNAIIAQVHMDEPKAQPHMHYVFIPVTKDKKTGIEKVSAKEVLTRQDLATFHQNLRDFLEEKLGHSVEVVNGNTKSGNRSITQLRYQTMQTQLANGKKKVATLTLLLNTYQKNYTETLARFTTYQQSLTEAAHIAFIQRWNSPLPKDTLSQYSLHLPPSIVKIMPASLTKIFQESGTYPVPSFDTDESDGPSSSSKKLRRVEKHKNPYHSKGIER